MCVSTAPEPHQRYTRCGLPLTLLCGHGVCYHCVVSRRSVDRNGSKVDLNKFHCKVCDTNNPIQLEALHQDVLGAVNWCQLGLVRLKELGEEVAGDSLQWKRGTCRRELNEFPKRVVFSLQIPVTGCSFQGTQRRLQRGHLTWTLASVHFTNCRLNFGATKMRCLCVWPAG